MAVPISLDDIDRRILDLLQADASLSLSDLSERVHLSRNALWRRIQRLEGEGVVRERVAHLDPAQLNLALSVFIAIRTERHTAQWLASFDAAVRELPEILGVYRMAGNVDYLLFARVPDMAAYDALYKRLIAAVELTDVSSSFVMEEIKSTTRLPLHYV